ncbi:hypothetical protein M9434_004413 [Picochlorum sp. BPE23]|nr:hypothetical protein M9434_004413 [Picochlorum sp. BPE23]
MWRKGIKWANTSAYKSTTLAPSVVEQESRWESHGEEIDTFENDCVTRKVSLERRLEQADQRRQAFLTNIQQRVKIHHDNIKEIMDKGKMSHESALETLNLKLEEAGQKRERFLETVKAKASVPSQRVEKVRAAQKMQKRQKEQSIEQSLSQAERLRRERLAEASMSAAKHCQQVVQKAREMREKERQEAEDKIRLYHQRQQAAADARRRLTANQQESLLTAALSNGRQKDRVPKTPEKDETNKIQHDKKRVVHRSQRRRSELTLEKAIAQFYESGIPTMISGRGMLKDESGLQSSLTELSESLASSMDSGRAPVPMTHQVSNSTIEEDSDSDNEGMSFDRFAELIADLRILRSVQKILSEIQSVHEEGIGASSQKARYPTRIFLSAFMVVNYPEVVLSGIGAQETKLTMCARAMITAFDDLVKDAKHENVIIFSKSMVENFDSTWIVFQEQFCAWKSHDAAGLESDLIKAAVELESSRLLKIVNVTDKIRHMADMEALSQAVDHDLQLIEDRICSLTGEAGVSRLRAALEATRSHVQETNSEVFSSGSISAKNACSQPSLAPQGNGSSDSVQEFALVDKTMQSEGASEWDNLSLIWNLLYDPEWRLPTKVLEMQWDDALGKSDPFMETADEDDDATLKLLSTRKREIERWKSLEDTLKDMDGTDNKFNTLLNILITFLERLQSFAPKYVSREFTSAFGSTEDMKSALAMVQNSAVSWINVSIAFDYIEWCSKTIAQLCAPYRDSEIQIAQKLMSEQVKEALAARHTCEAIMTALVQCLRMTELQIRLLGMDLANAHLEALTSHFSRLSLAVRVAYARRKFSHELDLTENEENEYNVEILKSKLPKTRGWLAIASGKLPRVAADLGHLDNADSSASPNQISTVQMRTGFDITQSTVQESGPDSVETPKLALKPISSMSSWKGLVRIGLVHLVSGDGAIGSLSLPETLKRDYVRLFEMKNNFQIITVLAICMSIIDSSVSKNGRSSMTDTVLLDQKKTAKARIQSILQDPGVSLKDISLEVSKCVMTVDPTVESLDALAAHMSTILKALLHRSSQQGRHITETLSSMLLHLLTKHNCDTQIHTLCQKLGAPEIAPEVLSLGKDMRQLAAVTEAVCKPWYQSLSSEFLRDNSS